MRVDDSGIRKEKVADSKISGYVWTGSYSYPFQTSPKATPVSESFSFQESGILFPGEVWIFLELENADGLCHLRSMQSL